MAIQLTINGEAHQAPDGSTIESLLQELGKNPKLCAVEVNRSLIPRAKHGQTSLTDGDQVEIVTLVGGG